MSVTPSVVMTLLVSCETVFAMLTGSSWRTFLTMAAMTARWLAAR